MVASLFIEPFGIGHAVAAVENGTLVDLLIDPLDHSQQSLLGSVMSVKIGAPIKGINGTFVVLPNGDKGFIRGRHNFSLNSCVAVSVGTHAEDYKAQPVSTNLIFKGRYVILTPSKPGLNISRSIKDETSRANILSELIDVKKDLPSGCGLIIRSSAANVEPHNISEDTQNQLKRYQNVLNDDFSKPKFFEMPLKSRQIAFQEWEFFNPNEIIEEEFCFDRVGLWEQISQFLIPKVSLLNGGFLMIEPTSAFVAVDINSGSDTSYAAALKTNLLAMAELPRQLQIRGLGGKVIIEFAPLSKTDRTQAESELKKSFDKNKIESTIVGWTKLGNLEIQRKRERAPISSILKKDNRFCKE
jgi:ribonuclease G